MWGWGVGSLCEVGNGVEGCSLCMCESCVCMVFVFVGGGHMCDVGIVVWGVHVYAVCWLGWSWGGSLCGVGGWWW